MAQRSLTQHRTHRRLWFGLKVTPSPLSAYGVKPRPAALQTPEQPKQDQGLVTQGPPRPSFPELCPSLPASSLQPPQAVSPQQLQNSLTRIQLSVHLVKNQWKLLHGYLACEFTRHLRKEASSAQTRKKHPLSLLAHDLSRGCDTHLVHPRAQPTVGAQKMYVVLIKFPKKTRFPQTHLKIMAAMIELSLHLILKLHHGRHGDG